MTLVANLELRVSLRIFEKNRNEYSGAWGKLIHEKTSSRKSRDTVPLTSLTVARLNHMASAAKKHDIGVCIIYGFFKCRDFVEERG